MKLTRTAKIKLNVLPSEMLPTLIAYTKAFNFVCEKGFAIKEKNGIEELSLKSMSILLTVGKITFTKPLNNL